LEGGAALAKLQEKAIKEANAKEVFIVGRGG
jgi:hypothetical protein